MHKICNKMHQNREKIKKEQKNNLLITGFEPGSSNAKENSLYPSSHTRYIEVQSRNFPTYPNIGICAKL